MLVAAYKSPEFIAFVRYIYFYRLSMRWTLDLKMLSKVLTSSNVGFAAVFDRLKLPQVSLYVNRNFIDGEDAQCHIDKITNGVSELTIKPSKVKKFDFRKKNKRKRFVKKE